MTDATRGVRGNQRLRTRKDLLQATARLLKQGRKPTLEEVAEEALVSRATAYRYFPGVEELLVEALLDVSVPDARRLFENDSSDDPVVRLERADDALHKMISENEAPLRIMLANSLEQRAKQSVEGNLPVRQNRRTPLIEASLAPARNKFEAAQLEILMAALALIIGTEAMIVFRDVLHLNDCEAQNVRHWAIRALVAAAMKPQHQASKVPLTKPRRKSHVHKTRL